MTTELYFKICDWLAQLIKGTKWEGHVFSVGGCCRDEILGLDIKDLDLAVDLPNGGVEFARWLQRQCKTVSSPIFFYKFGTAKLTLRKWPEEEIEVVQTRSEKYTNMNSRCPEVVSGTIEEDCYRRDFTVNTLYRDVSSNQILDITGHGIADIKSGILRTPLEPDNTFDDDPVRILRCIRFATRFGWKIEQKTMEAIKRNIGRLAIVSRERNRSELGKMVAGKDPVGALTMLKDLDALKYMLPLLAELSGTLSNTGTDGGMKSPQQVFPKAESDKIWNKAMSVLKKLPEGDIPLRLAALFADCGKLRTRVRNKKGEVSYPNYDIVGANMARRALRSLKFEISDLDQIAFLISNQNGLDLWGKYAEMMTDKELRLLQYKAGTPELLYKLLKLIDARNDVKGQSPLTARIRQRTSEMVKEGSDLFNRTIMMDELDEYLSNPPRRHHSNRR